MVQALSECDKEKRHEFSGEMFDKMQNEDDYRNKTVINEKTTFHPSGKANRHNGLQRTHMRSQIMCVTHQN